VVLRRIGLISRIAISIFTTPPSLVPTRGVPLFQCRVRQKQHCERAQAGALSEYVVEWAGKRVKSLKRGIKTARTEAGITKIVSPHILRHSAAVHMAEKGRSMEEIQQFLGHSDINVTRKIYARFSPSYLREAAEALEIDGLGTLYRRELPNSGDQALISLGNLVGATGIEPVTPTMSR
jgi:Phage integrase family